MVDTEKSTYGYAVILSACRVAPKTVESYEQLITILYSEYDAWTAIENNIKQYSDQDNILNFCWRTPYIVFFENGVHFSQVSKSGRLLMTLIYRIIPKKIFGE